MINNHEKIYLTGVVMKLAGELNLNFTQIKMLKRWGFLFYNF
jgi:hypothetical protein